MHRSRHLILGICFFLILLVILAANEELQASNEEVQSSSMSVGVGTPIRPSRQSRLESPRPVEPELSFGSVDFSRVLA